jgi:hypothetical protein
MLGWTWHIARMTQLLADRRHGLLCNSYEVARLLRQQRLWHRISDCKVIFERSLIFFCNVESCHHIHVHLRWHKGLLQIFSWDFTAPMSLDAYLKSARPKACLLMLVPCLPFAAASVFWPVFVFFFPADAYLVLLRRVS